MQTQERKRDIKIDSRWAALIRRLLSLPDNKQYIIAITKSSNLEWSIAELGKTESALDI